MEGEGTIQVNVGLITYLGPGLDDPLVQAQLAHNRHVQQNLFRAIQNPAVAEIDASSHYIEDDCANRLAQALRCVDARGGKQQHERVSAHDA